MKTILVGAALIVLTGTVSFIGGFICGKAWSELNRILAALTEIEAQQK